MGKIKPLCKYGSICYRKNPQHFLEYSHGSQPESEDESTTDSQEGATGSQVKNGQDTDVSQEAEPVPAASTDSTKKRSRVDDYFSKTVDVKRTKSSSEVVEPGTSSSSEQQAADDDATLEVADVSTSFDAADVIETEPSDVRENIKSKFLVEMPEDFYEFWEFSKTVNSQKPAEAFSSTLGLHLVGPYDILAGKTQQAPAKRPNYLRHWRYYYDPPEFLTVLRGDDRKQFHIGYFRDDPSEMPSFLAWNEAAENCNIKPCGENLFAAVSWFIEDKLKKDGKSQDLLSLHQKLKDFAEKKSLTLEQKTAAIKARDKKVVSKCFHGAGIVVPVDKNGVGYRPLPETPGSLRKIFQRIVDSKSPEERDEHFDALTEIITYIQFANDECDYGEGLELGLDIFCFGSTELHSTIRGLLPLAYQLLGRDVYAKIIEAHLADRRRSPFQH